MKCQSLFSGGGGGGGGGKKKSIMMLNLLYAEFAHRVVMFEDNILPLSLSPILRGFLKIQD